MYQVRFSTESASDQRARFWSDGRFSKREGKARPRVARARFFLFAGLVAGFCLLLAFAGCGSIENSAGLIATVSGVDFGSVTVGQVGSKTISFQNSSPGSVQVTGITLTGPFKLAAAEQFPLTIASGASYTLQVQFAPSVAGQASGAITVQNSTGVPPAVSMDGLGVSASGTPGVPYTVDLTWDPPASSSDPVVGYNLYRALNGSQSYLRLNSTVNATTAFADATVASGQSYVYYVTAVDSAGFESAPSNTFNAAIP